MFSDNISVLQYNSSYQHNHKVKKNLNNSKEITITTDDFVNNLSQLKAPVLAELYHFDFDSSIVTMITSDQLGKNKDIYTVYQHTVKVHYV